LRHWGTQGLKSGIFWAFSKNTTGHLIVECKVVILWAFSMGQKTMSKPLFCLLQSGNTQKDAKNKNK